MSHKCHTKSGMKEIWWLFSWCCICRIINIFQFWQICILVLIKSSEQFYFGKYGNLWKQYFFTRRTNIFLKVKLLSPDAAQSRSYPTETVVIGSGTWLLWSFPWRHCGQSVIISEDTVLYATAMSNPSLISLGKTSLV